MEDNFNHDAFIDAYNERMERLTDMGEQQKQTTYANRTCQVASPYVPNKSAPPPPSPQPKTGDEIKIETLTEENKKLREDYAGLVKKANLLIEAYRKLKTENEVLTLKKAKVDAKAKTVEDTKKFFSNIGQKFITWLKT